MVLRITKDKLKQIMRSSVSSGNVSFVAVPNSSNVWTIEYKGMFKSLLTPLIFIYLSAMSNLDIPPLFSSMNIYIYRRFL